MRIRSVRNRTCLAIPRDPAQLRDVLVVKELWKGLQMMDKPKSITVLLTAADIGILRQASAILNDIANRASRKHVAEVCPVGPNNIVVKRADADITVAIKKSKKPQ
jgi:hypothetical protein